MSQVINTNVDSLFAQHNLSQTKTGMSQTLERLSTGLRINSARDDAAGLGISERMTAQIRGLDMAVRNSHDGISFTQTAEGALGTVTENLQRMRELAVQANNAPNSSNDRTALNNEVQALIAEISRVSFQTEFNGSAILNGSMEQLFFQTGANQGQMIGVTGVDSRTDKLGTFELVTGDRTEHVSSEMLSRASNVIVTGGTFTIAGHELTYDGASSTIQGTAALEQVVANMNAAIQRASTSGGVASQQIAEVGAKAQLRIDNSGNVSLAMTGTWASAQHLDRDTTAAGGDASQFRITAGFQVQIATTSGDGTTTNFELADGMDDRANICGVSLNDLNVLSREKTNQALGIIDGALDRVNSLRSELGASQTRFENAIKNLSTTSNNLSAARSRIQDADFAKETAQLTRLQILQQAGISVLSQANQSPQSALALLQ